MENYETAYDTRVLISLLSDDKKTIDLLKQFYERLNNVINQYEGNTRIFLQKELQYSVKSSYVSIITNIYPLSYNDDGTPTIVVSQADHYHPHFTFYIKLLLDTGLNLDLINIIYRSDQMVGGVKSFTNDLYGLLTFHNKYKFTSFYEANPKPIYNFYKRNHNSPYINIDEELMSQALLYMYSDLKGTAIIKSDQEVEIYFDDADALDDFVNKIFGVRTEAVNNSIRYVEYKQLYQVDSDLVY